MSDGNHLEAIVWNSADNLLHGDFEEEKRKFCEILWINATVKGGKIQVSCLIESCTSAWGVDR